MSLGVFNHVRFQPKLVNSGQRGFALVIALSLMAFVLLLLLSMTTLVQVETQSAKNSSTQLEAEQNALLGIQIALGELQRTTGPDQRVTALANIAGTSMGDSLADGAAPSNNEALSGAEKGLSAIQAGTRFWTGVFTNTDAPDDIYSKTPAPALVQWLVSGSRSDDPLAKPTLVPNDSRALVGANSQVTDTTQAVVLVGKNSVGSVSDDTLAPARSVAVPLVEIESGGPRNAVGRFGWWVGDEGQKARLNIAQKDFPDLDNYASLVAQRRGWETVTGLSSYPAPDSPQHAGLGKIISNSEVDLLLPGLAAITLQNIFHSATTSSRGLLVDTLSGGTRVDLTSAFSDDLSSSRPADGYDNYPTSGARVIPTTAVPGLQHLKWDHLLRFYELHDQLSGGVLKVRSRTAPDTDAIAPAIIELRMLLGARLTSTDTSDPDNRNYTVNPCAKIALTIANPYSVPLEWDDDLEFEIEGQTPDRDLTRVWLQVPNNAAIIPEDVNEPAVFNQTVFRITPARLEPGEARTYTQSSPVLRSVAEATGRTVVDMTIFEDASPFDFKRSVEMDIKTPVTVNSAPYDNANPRLELRILERGRSSLFGLEMRLGEPSSNQWLCRIDGFELDNGVSAVRRRIETPADASQRTEPVPLMLYSFQISQPGMDYQSLGRIPGAYEMGQRASTLRTFADFNLRAANLPKPIASYNPTPYFMESTDSASSLPFIPPGGDTGNKFTQDSLGYWGRSTLVGSDRTVLFSIPRQFTSLAQFQHADLTGDDTMLSLGHQPGNAFGNSYASPFLERERIVQPRVDYGPKSTDQTLRNYYDIAHLLNSSIWDRFFFSTIPSDSNVPENPTLLVANGATVADLRDPSKAAASLLVEGAFNINSTDPQAWKAFLASAKHFRHSADTVTSADAAFPRSLDQPSEHLVPPSGEANDSYAGYRRLTDGELDALSREIVKQVRLRGPFVSISHFVNRALAGINQDHALSRSGALQFALDESGINISHDGNSNGFSAVSANEDLVTLRIKQGAPRADMDGGYGAIERPADADPSHPDWAVTSQDKNYGAVASILADQEMLAPQSASIITGLPREQGYRSTGIPGWVTQADVLQVIGPAISARSDTFRIRAHGEALGLSGNVSASAYCEVVVQRQLEYIDPANQPHDRPILLTDTNKAFGRRYEIVSFTWLSPDDI